MSLGISHDKFQGTVSCAWHIISLCFISVPSFIKTSLTLFKLLGGQEIIWIIKGNNSKITQTRVIILVHNTLAHCGL